MRPNAEITKYRLERWLQRFEELWDSVDKYSLVRGRGKQHLQSLPTRFPDLFLSAVARYLERVDMMEENDEHWASAHFFGIRAYRCPHFTSEDAWDLCVSFPVGADYPEEKILCAYVKKMFESAASDRDLLSAAERTVSLAKLWNEGMTPWLLRRIASVCGTTVFDSIEKIADPVPATHHRTMATLVDSSIDVFGVGLNAIEKQMEIEEEGRNAEMLQGELAQKQELIEGLKGALFHVNTKEKLIESKELSLDPARWRIRLDESGLGDVMDAELELLTKDEVERLGPKVTWFLAAEHRHTEEDIMPTSGLCRPRSD